MTLQQTDVVDFLGIEKLSGDTVLTLVDDCDWSNVESHLSFLQAKLNTYLRFIESGEIYSVSPDSEGRKIKIQIFAQYNVPPAGTTFLSQAARAIAEAGYCLCHLIKSD
jgi:hypothetical protein